MSDKRMNHRIPDRGWAATKQPLPYIVPPGDICAGSGIQDMHVMFTINRLKYGIVCYK